MNDAADHPKKNVPSDSDSCRGIADVEDLVGGSAHHPSFMFPPYPAVPMYGPMTVRGLAQGATLLYCQCGLSKKQPWCDGSHRGTSIKPLRWTVPGTLKDGRPQRAYSICNCKYTRCPPYCDTTHTNLPLEVLKRQRECTADHATVAKLCEQCGYTPLDLNACASSCSS